MYAAKCCFLPPLLDEDMTKKCSVTMRSVPPFAISQFGGRGIGNRQSNPFRYHFKQLPPQKNLSGKITVEQICLTDCVFRQYQWISSSNEIDANSLMQVLTSLVPQERETYLLLNSAMNACSTAGGVMSKADNATSMMRQRKCYHAPTKILRCIRRFMLINCPQVWSPSPFTTPKHCVLDKIMLDKCDVNTL
ncbi:hypothetical protein B566_EDAN010724 [Ephemera danica]|nr:hypothetical protein B566_EDAN010724 [Ephemera danica]